MATIVDVLPKYEVRTVPLADIPAKTWFYGRFGAHHALFLWTGLCLVDVVQGDTWTFAHDHDLSQRKSHSVNDYVSVPRVVITVPEDAA